MAALGAGTARPAFAQAHAPAHTQAQGAGAPASQVAPAFVQAAPAARTAAVPTGDTAANPAGNQAVAMTSTNAAQPAKGDNSFTVTEARSRIERQGYSQVADLAKDGTGIWRGRGMKDGSAVGVWLDYKGDVGRQ